MQPHPYSTAERYRIPLAIPSLLFLLLLGLPASSVVASDSPTRNRPGPFLPKKAIFHPYEESTLLIVEGDGQLSLWNLQDSTRHEEILTIQTNANDACFTKGGDAILSAGKDGYIRRWDLATGRETGTSQLFPDNRAATSVLAGDNFLVSADDGGHIRVWALQGNRFGELKYELSEGHGEHAITSMAISPTGDELTSIGSDGTFLLWDLPSGQEIKRQPKPLHGHREKVSTAAFSGEELISSGENGQLCAWTQDLESKEFKCNERGSQYGPSFGKELRSAILSQNGSFLAAIDHSGEVILWSSENRSKVPLRAPQGQVDHLSIRSVAASATRRMLAIVQSDLMVTIWKLNENTTTAIAGYGISSHTTSLSLTERLVASIDNDGFTHFADFSGNPRDYPGSRMKVESLALSPKGDNIAFSRKGEPACLARIDDAPSFGTRLDHQEVSQLAFSPTGNYLISIGAENSIIWSMGRKYERDISRVRQVDLSNSMDLLSVAISSTGRQVAFIDDVGAVWLYVFTNKAGDVERNPFRFQPGPATSVALSSSGDYIAYSLSNGVIQIDQIGPERTVTTRSIIPRPIVSLIAFAEDDSLWIWTQSGVLADIPIQLQEGWWSYISITFLHIRNWTPAGFLITSGILLALFWSLPFILRQLRMARTTAQRKLRERLEEKKDFLLGELALTDDSEKKFALNKKIERISKRLQRL